MGCGSGFRNEEPSADADQDLWPEPGIKSEETSDDPAKPPYAISSAIYLKTLVIFCSCNPIKPIKPIVLKQMPFEREDKD